VRGVVTLEDILLEAKERGWITDARPPAQKFPTEEFGKVDADDRPTNGDNRDLPEFLVFNGQMPWEGPGLNPFSQKIDAGFSFLCYFKVLTCHSILVSVTDRSVKVGP